jgi:hypothetical protein
MGQQIDVPSGTSKDESASCLFQLLAVTCIPLLKVPSSNLKVSLEE